MALAGACGVDFPWAVWSVAHGRPLGQLDGYSPGIRVRWTAGLFLRMKDLLRQQDDGLGTPSVWREVLACGSSFKPGTRDMLWSWSDPRPAVDELFAVVARTLRHESRRALRRWVPASLLQRARVCRRLGPRLANGYLAREIIRSMRGRRLLGPPPINSVLFVCHGNIIRSPMAASLLSRRICSVRVRSAGLNATSGRGADERALRIAREFGVDLHAHTASPLSSEAIADADLVLVMDAFNEARILQRFPESRPKVRLLGEFASTRLLDRGSTRIRVGVFRGHRGGSASLPSCWSSVATAQRRRKPVLLAALRRSCSCSSL